MRTDGRFDFRVVEIDVKVNKPFTIFFHGDEHFNSPNHAKAKWKQDALDMAEHCRKHQTYFIKTGDVFEAMSTSERRAYIGSGFHDSNMTRWEQEYMNEIDDYLSQAKFLKNRTLAVFGGNHFFQFYDGRTSDQVLAQKIGAPYIGCSGYVILILKYAKNHSRALKIFVHHGLGSGRGAGSTFNALDKAASYFPDADILCLTDDTEVLTNSGWKKFCNLEIGHHVYSFNNGVVENDSVSNIICKEHSGEVFKFKNGNIDFITTPEHRIHYKSVKNYLYKSAKDFYKMNGNVKIPLAGHLDSKGIDGISNDFCELMGWIISEGSFRKNINNRDSGIAISQKPNRYADKIKDCLDRNKLQYFIYNKQDGMRVFYIKTSSSNKILKLLPSKEIPEWCCDFNQDQFEHMLKSLMMGDGNWSINGKCGTYYSINEKLIDSLQHLCCLHGYRTSKKFKKGGFKNGCWVLYITKRDSSQICSIKDVVSKGRYKGKVWCITTKAGNFIARRNGKPFVTGNCMGHDHQCGAMHLPAINIEQGRGGTWQIKEHDRVVGRAGSYLKSYEPGKASYAVDAMYRPSTLGALRVDVTLRRECAPRIKGKWSGEEFRIECKAVI